MRTALLLSGAMVLAACGQQASPRVDPVQTAQAPECHELAPPTYDPPPEEQPDPDPSLIDRYVESLRAWAGDEAADSYAGLWLDNQHGAPVVAFTDDVDVYADQVRDRFGEGWWVVRADHSEAELRQVQDELMVEMGGGEAEPGTVYGIGLQTMLNRVTVSILEPDADRLQELSDRYGADRLCFEVERMPGADDAQPAPWEPAPDADLSPTTTSIPVLVNERACASGQPADGRIADPQIDYLDDAIVITIAVVPKPGAQRCPGNPDTLYTVELDEPLRDRELLDGSQNPPATPDLEAHR